MTITWFLSSHRARYWLSEDFGLVLEAMSIDHLLEMSSDKRKPKMNIVSIQKCICIHWE